MLGPALIAAVVALEGESLDPTPPMSLPLEDILCFDREPPPPPVRGRACIEIDGVPGMECWPELPATAPSLSFGWSVRAYTAARAPELTAPSYRDLPPPAHDSKRAEGHARLPDEPPRS
jgi:hypothetical protein